MLKVIEINEFTACVQEIIEKVSTHTYTRARKKVLTYKYQIYVGLVWKVA